MPALTDLELYDLYAATVAKDLRQYLEYVVIDSRPPRRLSLAIEPWQRDLYAVLVPLFEAAAGIADTNRRCAFVVAPRGFSKTSTIAQLTNWLLCFARRPVSATVAACDRAQAHILLERMAKEAGHNQWLARQLHFHNYEVKGPTGKVSVVSSDAPSSAGKLDDLTVIDEICQFKKRDLFDMLMSGRNKRNGLVAIISNAGNKGTWQHEVWEEAQRSPNWITHEVPPFSASWLNREEIERDRRFLLPAIFGRMHENRWIDLSEEMGYVTRPQVEACVTYTQQAHGDPRKRYVVALDLGIVHDRTAACVCHIEKGEVYLDELRVWQGSPKDRVQLSAVEDWLGDRMKAFSVAAIILDAYQLEHLAQKYERAVEVVRYNFAGSGHYQLADNLRSLILTRKIHLYPEAGSLIRNGQPEDLVDELAALYVEETSNGRWRFQHTANQFDDRAVCLGLGALQAVRLKKKIDPLSFMEAWNEPLTPMEEEPMYSQILEFKSYGSWQLTPTINGEVVRLNDYPTMHEAAFAANVVATMYGTTAPNVISTEKLPTAARQEQIKKDLVVLLEKRKLWPVKKEEPKKPEKEEPKKDKAKKAE